MFKVFVTIIVVCVILFTGLFFIRGNKNSLISMDKVNLDTAGSLTIASPVFKDRENIPVKYTCDGDNINPPLSISGVPKLAKSLALIVDDPDAPAGLWIHWVAWNIDPKTKLIPEGIKTIGINGLNTSGNGSYGGPCPPDKEHRYFFKIFALDVLLDVPQTSGADELIKAMAGHIIDKAELIGLYDRKR